MEPRSDMERNPTDPIKPRRPFVLSIILSVFIFWILLGWLRFARALMERPLIETQLSRGYFWYLVLAGFIWGLAGLPVVWGILRREPWTKLCILIIGLIYPSNYWIERLFIWAPSEDQGNWPFMLFLTVLWIAAIVWANSSKPIRRYFVKERP